MHEVLVNRLGGLSLPRKSVVRLTDRPDMTLDVYRGRKITMQQQQQQQLCLVQHLTLGLTTITATLMILGVYKHPGLIPGRSGDSVVDNTLDYQSKDRKIIPPLL